MKVEVINKFGLYKQLFGLYNTTYTIHNGTYSYKSQKNDFLKDENLIKKLCVKLLYFKDLVLKVFSIIHVTLFAKIGIHKKLMLYIIKKRTLFHTFLFRI